MKNLFRIISPILFLLFTISINAQKEQKNFFENGNIKAEGYIDANGEKTGLWKFYEDENGYLTNVEVFKNGEIIIPNEGCFNGDCNNGFGMKYNSKTSNYFIGQFEFSQFKKGIKVSKYMFITTYKGNFNYGTIYGEGEKYISMGDGLGGTSYSGMFKMGKKQGVGKEKITNIMGQKTSYSSNWVNDKKNGKGKEYVEGKLVFNGEFKNGKRIQ